MKKVRFDPSFSSGRDYGGDRVGRARELEEWSKLDPEFENRIANITNQYVTKGAFWGRGFGMMENPQEKDLIELAQDQYLREMKPQLRGLREAYGRSRGRQE